MIPLRPCDFLSVLDNNKNSKLHEREGGGGGGGGGGWAIQHQTMLGLVMKFIPSISFVD